MKYKQNRGLKGHHFKAKSDAKRPKCQVSVFNPYLYEACIELKGAEDTEDSNRFFSL